MPIYQYTCNRCNETFEAFLDDYDDYPGPCPKCRSKDLHKDVTPVGLKFIGQGWDTDARQKRHSVKHDKWDLVDRQGNPVG